MKKLFLTIVATTLISGNLIAAPATMSAKQCSPKQVALSMAMRELWVEHVVYTRNYIISAIANLGDKDVVAKRLLKNQDDIGNAIATYYGKDAGKALTGLLREHILISADVIEAAKNDNIDNLEQAQQKWFANADEIAVFLSNANPNWSKDHLSTMLLKHLKLTTGEVTSRLANNWKEDIHFFEQVSAEILEMADDLTAGIVKQFPEKFS